MTTMINMISQIDPTLSAASTDGGARDAKLRQACADFESIFVNYVLRSARKALPHQGLFHDSREGKIYESMMDEHMAQSVAKGRGLGLGALLYKQLAQEEHRSLTFSDSAFDPIRAL